MTPFPSPHFISFALFLSFLCWVLSKLCGIPGGGEGDGTYSYPSVVPTPLMYLKH